jgi:hypothetical protein
MGKNSFFLNFITLLFQVISENKVFMWMEVHSLDNK